MKHSDIPDWIRRACALWGRQKRRIWAGMDWHGNIDGYAQSLLGRIKEERDGASSSQVRQHWPEVFTGDGLDVQRSLDGLGEVPRAALHFRYVWDPDWNVTIADKAAYLGVGRTEYFELIARAESYMHGRLEVITSPDENIRRIVRKTIQQALTSGSPSAIKAQTSATCLNLKALYRPILRR